MTNGRADLSSARAKLDWANRQINILDAEIRAFIEPNPYCVREKPKPQLRREPNAAQRDLFEKGRFYEILLTEDIPEGIDASVGMVIQALRDSLDHLTHALAEKNGAVEPRDVYFPITETEDGFSDLRTQRKIARLAEDDRRAIEALKPYQGGNDLLYALHWLNNKSKHRKLIAIATGVHSCKFGGGAGRARRLLILPPGNTFCPDEPLICLDADENVNLNFTATIAFGEVGHTQGKPVVETLREFSRLANSIIDIFS